MKIIMAIENEKELDALIHSMVEVSDVEACRAEFQHDICLNLGGVRLRCNRGNEINIDINTDTLSWLSDKVGKLYVGLAEAATKAAIGQAKKMEGWGEHFIDPILTVDGNVVEDDWVD